MFQPVDMVATAAGRRHAQIRELSTSMLHGIDVDTSDGYLVETVYTSMCQDVKTEIHHGVHVTR